MKESSPGSHPIQMILEIISKCTQNFHDQLRFYPMFIYEDITFPELYNEHSQVLILDKKY